MLCIRNKYGPPKKTFLYKRFGYDFPAIQITVPTKSQGTQCTLLKEMFVTSTTCASDNEPSVSKEEMDADDNSLYLPSLRMRCMKMEILPISKIVCTSEFHKNN